MKFTREKGKKEELGESSKQVRKIIFATKDRQTKICCSAKSEEIVHENEIHRQRILYLAKKKKKKLYFRLKEKKKKKRKGERKGEKAGRPIWRRAHEARHYRAHGRLSAIDSASRIFRREREREAASRP